MDNDDILRGRVLTRREVLALMGAGSLALVVGCSGDDASPGATATRGATQRPASPASAATSAATAKAGATAVPSCIVRPDLTEGPYFVGEQLERSDIRTGSDGAPKDGTPFTLTFAVSRIGNDGSCQPLQGANVDVWHCDADGVYSGVQDPAFNTAGQTWLRGWQRTDADGNATFRTIYPGWYRGRATHIHFKIRTNPDSEVGTEFTSQLFMDDALNDRVYQQGVYAAKGVSGRTKNDADGIFRESGGQLTLDVQPSGDGYAAACSLGMQLDEA